ncbi:hypothetical protein Hanom_Chr10g00934151 [Helianthus anomalus]
MQEERECGGGLEEHVGMHGNLRSHNSVLHEVRNYNMDKGDNIGTDSQEWGQNNRDGGSNSGGPNQGFNVGIVGSNRIGFKHPRILAQSRKVKSKSFSPPVLRPLKRSRQQLDEEFSFPYQIPATAPVELFKQVDSSSQNSGLDLNRNAAEGPSCDTVNEDTAVPDKGGRSDSPRRSSSRC